MAITKADLVTHLQKEAGIQKKDAIQYVELLFETIKASLSKGEKIKISGFGNFVVRDKRARQGRNPKTGETLEITARRVLTFRPSKLLKSQVNGDPVDETDSEGDEE